VAGLLYYLLTFTESVGSVFGLRFAYEQPRYAVIQELSQNVEIRRYEPRQAIEATVSGGDRDAASSEAFALLFRYITGANRGEQKIAMTAPVRISEPMRISMTTPVQTSMSRGQISMRFFLPRAVAKAGAPAPLDSRLRLVQVPEMTVAVIRYSGVATQATRDHQAALLLGVLARSEWKADGDIFQFNYDPPFAIPFLRRNETAVPVVADRTRG
jgi:hypothetical protein